MLDRKINHNDPRLVALAAAVLVGSALGLAGCNEEEAGPLGAGLTGAVATAEAATWTVPALGDFPDLELTPAQTEALSAALDDWRTSAAALPAPERPRRGDRLAREQRREVRHQRVELAAEFLVEARDILEHDQYVALINALADRREARAPIATREWPGCPGRRGDQGPGAAEQAERRLEGLERHFDRRLEMLRALVGVTPEQEAQLAPELETARAAIAATLEQWAAGDLERADAREAMRATRATLHERVVEVLTAEQEEILEALRRLHPRCP